MVFPMLNWPVVEWMGGVAVVILVHVEATLLIFQKQHI